ncbi:MAG: GntR family transcriptional regulator [Anaerolineae bacterium]|nr:GntR family transcriptional regulator [Anaerolineae bacterium]MDW8098040.1 GntR family transcriptional regulator [Anaerolineae bacterium]
MSISKNHPVPIYYQLEQEIRHRIEMGEWKPGDLLPSERELAERYQISRMTVRQALANLVNDGLLYRERGRGTFVARPKIHKRLSSLTSFTEDMRARGKLAGAEVLQLKLEPASPAVARDLAVPAGQPIVLVERLRLADREPVGIERSHLSFAGCEAIMREDLTGSLYRLLKEKYGIIPTHAEERIEAGLCPAREAQWLGIHRSAPVLLITRVTYSQEGLPFEYVESVYRADRYTLHVSLTTAPGIS